MNTQYSDNLSLQEKLKMVAETMTGPITYGFTNDYMFRAVLQQNSLVLSEIVRVLLEIPKNKTVTCEIQNPIMLGKSFGSKDCILDIMVSVNGKYLVNMEMQMSVNIDWVKRSLYYGFDMYTNLKSGQDYSDCKPSYHIGFVKNSPFKKDSRFYSKFLLMEKTTHRIYSGDFQINMINLSQLENATEDDRRSGLYDWVRLFMATDWEELMEMAKQSEALGQAIVTLAELSEEEKIRQQCEARRKYEMDEQVAAKRFKRMAEAIEEKEKELNAKIAEVNAKTAELNAKDEELSAKDEELSAKDEELSAKDEELSAKDEELNEKERCIQDLMKRIRKLEENSNN